MPIDPMPMARAAAALLRTLESANHESAYVPLTPEDQRALRCVVADVYQDFDLMESAPGRFVITCTVKDLKPEDLALIDAHGLRHNATDIVIDAYKNQALRTIIDRKQEQIAAFRTEAAVHDDLFLAGRAEILIAALAQYKPHIEWPTVQCTLERWNVILDEFKRKGLFPASTPKAGFGERV